MRWITFFILLYVMDSLQLGRFLWWPYNGDHWPRIEYLAILAIFYAMFAAETAAPLCGLLCGVIYDLGSGEMIGVNAVPLALMTFMVVRVRLSIFREHVASQIVMTFVSILMFAILSIIMRWLCRAPMEGSNWATHLGHLTANGLYTAAVAPFFYWVFFRFQGILGFTSHGPRSRIHETRRLR